MAKMTKVFGAIFCVLGNIYFIVSVFLYLNTSAHLDYNTGKQMTFLHSNTAYYFIVSILLLGFGTVLVNDKVLENKEH